MNKLRIGNGAGFLGDNLDAPRRLVESAELDFLTLEYLAELTMSILARLREKNPALGFATDFVDVTRSLCPALKQQPRLKIVTNAGGVNPTACAAAVSEVLCREGLKKEIIGVVQGDDLLPRLDALQLAGCGFENMETGQPLTDLRQPIVCANAYLGAAPIVECLSRDARITITGRVADASLTVGPVVSHFNWPWDDWNRLAAASVAGHLIECGAQVTGGYSTRWRDRDLADVGYPIVEMEASGDSLITKTKTSGGVVNRQTVVEQLVYEIGDPAHYLTPDVDVDFTTVEVEDRGADRVAVRSASGREAPDSYKVSLAYRNGYMASSQLVVYGDDCVDKARASADMVFARLKRAGHEAKRTHVECFGVGESVPLEESREPTAAPGEVVMRLSVADERRETVERFTKEIAPLITSGPAGLAGYASGRSPVRPVFAYWPTLVPKEFIEATVDVRSAEDWLQSSPLPRGS